MSGAPPAMPEAARAAAAAMGAALDASAEERIGRYLARLLEVNATMNLTAVTDLDVAWSRHVLDSLTLVAPLRALGARRVVDVGAGGGLPGIPLAIALPDAEITLVEATKKKASFLERVAAELGLGVRVVADRAEGIGTVGSPHREAYDAAVVRALAPLPVLLELTLPLLRTGGHVLAIKGEKAAEEVAASAKALRVLHGRIVGQARTATGTIVTVEKTAPTPRGYPRAPGTPKRSPL